MRDNKGFTLVELLIVTVIIGILAAIAIPKFSATREKAYFAAMKSDLKNLASQQEIYYSDEYAYTATQADLSFVASDAVTVVVSGAVATGWAATAVHAAMPTEGCSIYYGSATAVAVGSTPTTTPTAAGAMACSD